MRLNKDLINYLTKIIGYIEKLKILWMMILMRNGFNLEMREGMMICLLTSHLFKKILAI